LRNLFRLFLFSIFLVNISCSVQAKELTKQDLGIRRNSDNVTVFLDEPIENVFMKLGNDYTIIEYFKSEGEISKWDAFGYIYPGVKIYCLRGFQDIYLIVITSNQYSTIDGIRIGDNISKVEKTYSKISKENKLDIITMLDGEYTKGFVFEFDENNCISEISLNVFSE